MRRRLALAFVGSIALLAIGGACQPSSQTVAAPSPVASVGELAGRVLEMHGSVTAKRASDSAPRALAVESSVFSDDVVTTGSGASIQIELLHNRAVWSLGARVSSRVDTSIAWSAPKNAGADLKLVRDDAEDVTHSAGRHASRESLSTGESAMDLEAQRKHDEAEAEARRQLEQEAREDAAKREAEEAARRAEEERLRALHITSHPVEAGSPSPSSTAIAYSTKSTYSFNDDTIDAELLRPDGEFLASRAYVSNHSIALIESSGAGTLVMIAPTLEPQSRELSAEITSRRFDFAPCIDAELKEHPALTGTITLHFTVGMNGAVTLPSADAGTTEAHASAIACLEKKMKKWAPFGKQPEVTQARAKLVTLHPKPVRENYLTPPGDVPY